MSNCVSYYFAVNRVALKRTPLISQRDCPSEPILSTEVYVFSTVDWTLIFSEDEISPRDFRVLFAHKICLPKNEIDFTCISYSAGTCTDGTSEPTL